MRLAALSLLSLLVLLAALLVARHPHSYAAQDRFAIAASSSTTYPVGTDELGRDRSVRLALALLLGLAGAVLASTFASLGAVTLGAGAAFCRPWVGHVLLYASDLFLTLPWIFLLMLVRAAFPLSLPPLQSASITFGLLALLGVPAFLRVNYIRTRRLQRSEWWQQAQAYGLHRHQLTRQLLPHLRPLLLTQFLLYIPACVIAEANLGALGLGIAEPLPSWGSMLQSLQSSVLLSSSKLAYLPIALLVAVLLCLELLLPAEDR